MVETKNFIYRLKFTILNFLIFFLYKKFFKLKFKKLNIEGKKSFFIVIAIYNNYNNSIII